MIAKPLARTQHPVGTQHHLPAVVRDVEYAYETLETSGLFNAKGDLLLFENLEDATDTVKLFVSVLGNLFEVILGLDLCKLRHIL